MKKTIFCTGLIFGLAFGGDITESIQKCENGDYKECVLVGVANQINHNYSEALKYLKKGCDGQNGSACFHLAYMHFNGKGVKIDQDKALELYVKSCDNNSSSGCGVIGNLYLQKKDFEKWVQYHTKGCELNSYVSCYTIAQLQEKAGQKKASKETYKKVCKLSGKDEHTKNDPSIRTIRQISCNKVRKIK